MADDKDKPEGEENFEDSGLGNLPPLSDFDSQSGLGGEGDAGMPPLSGFDSENDEGGLPPLGDSEGPDDGGAEDPSDEPVDLDSSGGSFSSGPTAIDTPTPQQGGGGFQDMAADSDFSPETPEVGPGPDSNVDTPMFDSAFGGGEDSGFDMNTPAPTQAMETPMFGDSGTPGPGDNEGDFGFDQGAFGGGGTPAPDFSPDTGMGGAAAGAGFGAAGGGGGGGFSQQPIGASPPPDKKSSAVPIIIAALVTFLIGIVAGPFISSTLTFLPNPAAAELADAQSEIQELNSQVASLRRIEGAGNQSNISAEELTRLTEEIADRSEELAAVNQDFEQASGSLQEAQENLTLIEQDIAASNEEFVLAQEAFEELENNTAIVQARQRGLQSEVERLTNLVDELETANTRRTASKDALLHNVERLAIQIKEGLPLTPAKYAHEERVAEVQDLQQRVRDAKWVEPELLQDYTDLYIQELEIGQKEAYFFARLPVEDNLGNPTRKWAEALMLGNRGVYFRTLDGENIGIFTNTGSAETPNWEIVENTGNDVQQAIESRIIEARVPGFREKIQYLADKEISTQEGNRFQRAFESL